LLYNSTPTYLPTPFLPPISAKVKRKRPAAVTVASKVMMLKPSVNINEAVDEEKMTEEVISSKKKVRIKANKIVKS
jgi:hypothetical protein